MGDQFIPLAFKDDTYRAVIGSSIFGDAYYGDEWDNDFWDLGFYHQATTLDVTGAFFPPVGGEADEPKAAQWDNEGYQFEALEDGWAQTVYGFPDQDNDWLAALFPPDVTESFFAQYPLAEQPWFPDEESQDYANDSSLDVTAAFFPPDVTTDFLATQPLAEQPWFPDQEIDTELQNDSTLDVTPQFFPPAAADDSYIGITALQTDQSDFSEPDWDFNQQIDQQEELIAGPDDAFDVTIAAQYPLAEQPWFPDQETEDYQPEADVSAFLAGPPLFAPDEILAAQPLMEPYDQGSFPPDDPTEDQPYVEQNEGFLSPNDSTDTTTAATWFLPEHPEPEPDFIPDAAVDQAESLGTVAAIDAGLYAAQDLPDQQYEPEGFEPAVFIEGNEAFLSIPLVVSDPVLTAATELPGLGEFIPLDEEPVQPHIAELRFLFPGIPLTTIPPITKQALWRQVLNAGGRWSPITGKLALWRPLLPRTATHEPLVSKRAVWSPTDDGWGSVP